MVDQKSLPEMLFILGRGRSGTTLLKSILDMHPRLSVATESLFMMNAYSKYAKGPWSDIRIEAFVDDLYRESRFPGWGLDREKILAALLEVAPANRSFSSLCQRVYAVYAESQGKSNLKFVGDKNPHYALFLPKIKSLFPTAKFIHVTRDYRDNILSYRSVKFDMNGTAALAYRWNLYNEAIMRAFDGNEDAYLRVRFEDIVEHPERTLHEMCTFLGVDYFPEMLEFYKKKNTARKRDWHGKLEGPLDPRQLEKWKSKLSPDEVQISEEVCGGYAEGFGYKRSQASVSLVFKQRLMLFGASSYAKLYTMLERGMFLLPISLRSWMLSAYRKMTGST